MPGKHGTVGERLWPKVDMRGPMISPHLGPCWLWQAEISKSTGYGRFRVSSTRSTNAHRALWEWMFGAVPADRDLDHLCRNRACVNPAHLEPVTRRENLLRGVGLTAKYAKRTHCAKGHPFAGSNLEWSTEGHRRCRTCRLEWRKARREAGGSYS